MKKGHVFILSGPSGSGKTTFYEKLLKNIKFKRKLSKTVSMTTRPMRSGEQNGRSYFFVSKKMFLYKIQANHFLEWEKVFDNYYGTPNKHFKDLLCSGKNVLLCIDVKGAKTVSKKYPEAIQIFVKTPSVKVLADRLMRRGSETNKTLALRLKTAKKELLEEKRYDHVIVNSRLDTAYSELKKVISKYIYK